MTPLLWLMILMAFVPSIPLPRFVRNSFPLNLMQGPGDSRFVLFMRIIVASALFGLLCGCAVMAVQYLARIFTS